MCDEKSQSQALDRTQPGLPLRKGRYETMTHDDKRNGTTCPFAAMNTATGEVIVKCMKKHREWLRLLNLIRCNAPRDKEIHIICDNYLTHKHAKVKAWFARNPSFHAHSTLTSATWLDMVERFLSNITVNSLRRGVFPSVETLIEAFEAHVARHNGKPKAFF